MKKKIVVMLSLVLCLMLSISLAACNKNKHEAKSEWKFDNAQHWHECATKGHDDKLDVAAHVYDKEVVADEYRASEATYTEPAKYYKSCVCGAKGTETFNNGSTLSAQDNQVNLKSGVTLGKTYDGVAYSLSADKFTFGGNGAITFEYKSEGASDWSQTAPVNAGDYKVRVSVAATAEWKAAQETFDFAIAKKQLTISGTTVADKVYDGTKDAVVTAGTLAGLIVGDEVSVGVTAIGAFASKDVAYELDVEPQDVTVSYTLTGDLAKNYFAPVGETLQAKINPKTLSNVNLTKVYDGNGKFERTALTVEQGLIAGESIKIYVDATDANVGVYKDAKSEFNEYVLYIGDSKEQTVNYAWGDSCTATIEKLQLVVNATVENNTYDGTTNGSLKSLTSNAIEGDNLTITPTVAFVNKCPANNVPCNISYAISGTSAENYIAPETETKYGATIFKYTFTNADKIYVSARYVNNAGNVSFENVVVTGDIFEGDRITATITPKENSVVYGLTYYKSGDTSISSENYIITFDGEDAGNYEFRYAGADRYNPNVYLNIYEQEVKVNTETQCVAFASSTYWVKVDLTAVTGENGYSLVPKTEGTIATSGSNAPVMYDEEGNVVENMKPTKDGTYFIKFYANNANPYITVSSPKA